MRDDGVVIRKRKEPGIGIDFDADGLSAYRSGSNAAGGEKVPDPFYLTPFILPKLDN